MRTKKLSTLMQRRIADCVRKCSASTNGGDQERREADVQRNELVSMLTQWPAACLAFAGCGLAGLARVMFNALRWGPSRSPPQRVQRYFLQSAKTRKVNNQRVLDLE